MPKTTYTERPHQVEAEQFLTDKSWPALVDDCGLLPDPHVHIGPPPPLPPGQAAELLPLQDTDWIVQDGGSVFVLSDADFNATYVKKTGP